MSASLCHPNRKFTPGVVQIILTYTDNFTDEH